MRQRKFNSQALRQLAEELLHEIAEEGAITAEEREDLTTALVRQWITYAGNATLLLGEQQVYLVLGKTPLGRPCVVPEPALRGWMKELTRDWKIIPDDLDEIIDQLNRGQSAETVNADGIPLRLWVDPKERSRGVEPLVKENIPPGTKINYQIIATNLLEQQFGDGLDPEETEALACSMAKQWRQYEGHACLFIDGPRQLFFKLSEGSDGGCEVVTQSLAFDLEPLLLALGLSPGVIPEAIARINLNQEIEFRDREGIPSLLWHDPKARRILVRPVAADPGSEQSGSSAIFCGKCAAVLKPWRAGEKQQTCPHCGHTTTLA